MRRVTREHHFLTTQHDVQERCLLRDTARRRHVLDLTGWRVAVVRVALVPVDEPSLFVEHVDAHPCDLPERDHHARVLVAHVGHVDLGGLAVAVDHKQRGRLVLLELLVNSETAHDSLTVSHVVSLGLSELRTFPGESERTQALSATSAAAALLRR